MKKNRNNYFLLLVSFISLLVMSCARVGTPTGGAKDEIPPRVVQSKPKNYSKNFTKNKIEITFDEFVQIKNLREELVISPPLSENIISKLRGKKLILDLNNELADSTTYTLNFGNALVDNNEGNPLIDYEYVFSTGDFLDSLSVTGSIVQAFDLQPTKDPALIMLYGNLNDSAPLVSIPSYVGKSDKKGNFRVNNIKAGVYKVFALTDKNSNMIYDLPDESIAFIDSAFIFDPSQIQFDRDIIIDTTYIKEYVDSTMFSDSLMTEFVVDSITGDTIVIPQKITYALHVNLFMFTEITDIQYLTNKDRIGKEQFLFTFNRPLYDSLTIYPLNFKYDNNPFLKEVSLNNDSILYWITDTTIANMDTLLVKAVYSIKDTMNNIVPQTDTISLIYRKPEVKTKRRRNRKEEEETDVQESLELALNIQNNSKVNLNTVIHIRTAKPVFDFDTSHIHLFKMVDTLEVPEKFSFISDSLEFRKFKIRVAWEEETRYRLFLEPKAFTDIYSTANDTLEYRFSTPSLESYGKVILNISGISSPHIIQLLDLKDKVMRAENIVNDTTVIFDFLQAKKYKIKTIVDKNSNYKWDTGDYLKRIQPEKVLYYPKEIEVKSNWDIDIDWALSE